MIVTGKASKNSFITNIVNGTYCPFCFASKSSFINSYNREYHFNFNDFYSFSQKNYYFYGVAFS